MFAIMCASGNTGRALAELLLDAGQPVVALGRSEARLRGLARRGAKLAVGEPTDAGYLTATFRGAEGVFTMLPPNVQAADYAAYQDRVGNAITTALGEANVRRAVFMSALGAELGSGTGPIAIHHRQEARLSRMARVELELRILRPTFFFENHLATLDLIRGQGINGGALDPDVAIPMVATRDIAAAAATALTDATVAGIQVRELLGARDLTMREVTRIIGARIGRPELAYVQFPIDGMVASLVQAGFSHDVAGRYGEMFEAYNQGTIRPLAGRTPHNTTRTTFEAFAVGLAERYAEGMPLAGAPR